MTERFSSVLLYLRNQFRVNLFQIEFEQFGDAVLLHGDAVEDVGGSMVPRRWVMTMNWSCRSPGAGTARSGRRWRHPARLDLVEDAEGRGVDGEDGEIDADGHQRLLAAGQGFQVLDDLARRGHPDADAAGEHVAFIFQHKAGLAAAEQLGKDTAKFSLMARKLSVKMSFIWPDRLVIILVSSFLLPSTSST